MDWGRWRRGSIDAAPTSEGVRLAQYTLAPCGSRTQLFRSRGANRARGFAGSHPRTMEGAGKTGYPLIPMVRVQQKARGRTTGSANNRPSLRNGVTAYTCSPRGPAFLPPSPAGSSHRRLDASNGAPGPHDFAVREPCRSSVGLVASIAFRPNVRDDRDTSLDPGPEQNGNIRQSRLAVKRQMRFFGN
jgi:hypothetical protein